MKRVIYSPSSTIITPAFFGDGSDGDLVCDNSTIIQGGLNYRNITIPAGITCSITGGRVSCSGTFKNLGTLNNDGGNASGATPGNSNSALYNCYGMAGAAGRTTAGVGASTTPINAGNSDDSCGSGAGGAAGGNAGGFGSFGITQLDYALNNFTNIVNIMAAYDPTSPADQLLCLGQGGGSGGMGAGAVGSSGGGGGGAGLIWICAKYIQASSGRFYARGGAGGNASGTGNIGGGGGGGGGRILLAGLQVTTGTISVAMGAGGLGLGTGANGVTGYDGSITIVRGL